MIQMKSRINAESFGAFKRRNRSKPRSRHETNEQPTRGDGIDYGSSRRSYCLQRVGFDLVP
jgi:hypothetical protein